MNRHSLNLCLLLCSKIGVTNAKAKSYVTHLKLCPRKITKILSFLGYKLQAFSIKHLVVTHSSFLNTFLFTNDTLYVII